MTVGIPEYRLPREPLLGRDREHPAGRRRDSLQPGAGQRFHRWTTCSTAMASTPWCWPSARTRAASWASPARSKHGVIHGMDFLRDVALDARRSHDGEQPRPSAARVAGKRVARRRRRRRGHRRGAHGLAPGRQRGPRHLPPQRRRHARRTPEEIEAAEHEGIQFHFLANPIAVLGDDHVTGVRAAAPAPGRVRQQRPPQARCRWTATSSRSTWTCSSRPSARPPTCRGCDGGQPAIETTRASTFVVNEAFNTTRPGVFAAGDAVSGPATVIQAVAQGNLVAVAVDALARRPASWIKPHYETPRPDIVAALQPGRLRQRQRRPQCRSSAVTERRAISARSSWASTSRRRARKRSAACGATWNGWIT